MDKIQEIMASSVATDLSRLATCSEKGSGESKKSPWAMISTIEFNRIVWNNMSSRKLFRSTLKAEKEGHPLTV